MGVAQRYGHAQILSASARAVKPCRLRKGVWLTRLVDCVRSLYESKNSSWILMYFQCETAWCGASHALML